MGVSIKASSFMRYSMPWGGGMSRAGQTETSLSPSTLPMCSQVCLGCRKRGGGREGGRERERGGGGGEGREGGE